MTELVTTTTVYRIKLPWSRPPLSLNQRLHWAAHAKTVATVRETTGWLVKSAKIPSATFCEVTLVWSPGQRRVRDEENPVSTLKACCDGIVDAGVVVDDRPEFMKKNMPVIEPPSHEPEMWLIVETRSA